MNYAQYLKDYWPEEDEGITEVQQNNYYDQVTCIDRQIAELQARKDAILHGYCFTGYVNPKPYVDPYNLDERFTNRRKQHD